MFFSKYWAKICKVMPDEIYLKWQFHHIYHRKLDIDEPKTYADKLAYLKTHYKDNKLERLVDKYEVRKFVLDKIGSEYLIPLIGVYESTDDIPWNSLPSKYVLKCTHDSGSVLINNCNDNFDIHNAIALLKKNMSRNLYWYSREYPYKNLKPRILCEKYLDEDGHPPIDYKFMCFDGQPCYIILDINRFSNHQRDIYDISWNKKDITTDHLQSNIFHKKPAAFNEMITLAKKLSNGFKHVRVDFYYVKGKIYFGELTFFPWGGPIWFKPNEWNYKLGDLIKINA